MKTFLSGLFAAVFLAFGISAQAEKVALIKVTGTINPATAGYIARGIDAAAAEKVQCLILQLDTPGGLLDSTKDIVQSFYNAGVQSRQLIELLAGRINALLEDGGLGSCFLAASAPIHKQLFEALSPKARAKSSQLLASNLAKTDPGELPGHYERAAS